MADKHFASTRKANPGDGAVYAAKCGIRPNTSMAEGGTGMAARTHRLFWLCLTGLPMLRAVGRSGLVGLLVAFALTVGAGAVYTAFCLLDERDSLARTCLTLMGIVVVGSLVLSHPLVTWLTGAPLVALSLWLGYQVGPYALPAAAFIVRAYRRYLMYRVQNG